MDNTITIEAKPWYASKTILVNFATLVVAGGTALLGLEEFAELAFYLQLIVNMATIWLRTNTERPVATSTKYVEVRRTS